MNASLNGRVRTLEAGLLPDAQWEREIQRALAAVPPEYQPAAEAAARAVTDRRLPPLYAAIINSFPEDYRNAVLDDLRRSREAETDHA
jgi:hypothetical protein